jgi:hypothetical protein
MSRSYVNLVAVVLIALCIAMLVADGPWGPG